MRRDLALVQFFHRILDRWFIPSVKKMGLTPAALTVTGLVLSIAAGVSFLFSPVLAGFLALIGGLCDAMDGQLARNYGQDGPGGAFLDSVLDRYGEFFLLMGAWLYLMRFPALVFWGGVAVLAALMGSLMVSYTRARGEGLAFSCQEGLFQRPERLLVLVVGCLADPLYPGLILFLSISVVALGANLTALRRFRLIRAGLQRQVSASTTRDRN